MRKIILPVFLLLCVGMAQGQQKPTIKVRGEAKIDFVSDSAWLTRFDNNEIEVFREQNQKQTGTVNCDVLFLGSSSFRLWKTLDRDMAPLRVINRGYGGSTVCDQLYHYADVVGNYQPDNIAIYIGNDIRPAVQIFVGETYKRFCAFIERLHDDFPKAHIYLLAINITESRIAARAEIETFNALMAEYASLNPEWMTFLNTSALLLDEAGMPDNSLFVGDKLHLNEKGYERWTEYLRQYLIK